MRADIGGVLRFAMFSAKLERRRRLHRLALLVAVTLLAVGIALIAMWTVRALDMLAAAGADRTPVIHGVLVALAGLLALCLVAYGAIRVYGRVTSR